MEIVFLDAATMGGASLEPIARVGDLTPYPDTTPGQAPGRIKDAEVIIVNKFEMTADIIARAPKLKLICVAATGTNNIDHEAAGKRGIPVKNVAGYSTDAVAQTTFTQILHLIANPERYDHEVKSGIYTRSGIFTDTSQPFFELAGKTMGIIGMGTIGVRVATIATAFGMKVQYFSTSGTGHNKDYPCVSLETILRTSDIVSVHCPLNERTSNLIDKEQLAMMKSTTILANMARGGIVNEQALADAISAETIGGAVIDVYTKEPAIEDNPLLHTKHPEHLRLTPHIAWASGEAIKRLIEGIAENIKGMTKK